MQIYKTKVFAKWMKKTDLTDEDLLKAVDEMKSGLVDADLGGDVYKKRIGIGNRGKRAGVRTIVATRKADRWFFIFGFEKNTQSNISEDERDALQMLAKDLLGANNVILEQYIDSKDLLEVGDES